MPLHPVPVFKFKESSPKSELPRERCLKFGAECLSLRECLAVILSIGPKGKGVMGLSREILQKIAPMNHERDEEAAFFTFMESSSSILQEIKGVGPAHFTKLLVLFELAQRYHVFKEASRKKPSSKEPSLTQKAISKVPESFRQESREWVGFVALYRTGQLSQFCQVELGLRTHVNTDPAELFFRILSLRPRGFFLFHNHPSGSLDYSEEDLQMTEAVLHLAIDLGLEFYGHFVISPQGEQRIPFFAEKR